MRTASLPAASARRGRFHLGLAVALSLSCLSVCCDGQQEARFRLATPPRTRDAEETPTPGIPEEMQLIVAAFAPR